MQKWEYLQREAWRRRKGGLLKGWEEWENWPDLKELGEDGWELVSTCTISSYRGEALAGLSSNVSFIFKRPKQQ